MIKEQNYLDIELVSPKNMGYLRQSRYFKYKFDGHRYRSQYKKDICQSEYHRKLLEWEQIIRSILASSINEEEKRILKYREFRGNYKYREIDFIGRRGRDRLFFCEIKLKQQFKEKFMTSFFGWKQLNKSLSIAQNKYENISGLSICVDMTYLLNTDKLYEFSDYCKLNEISSYLDRSLYENNVIWLNSKDVFEYALNNGLIKGDQIIDLRKNFLELTKPMNFLKGDTIDNKPFEILSKNYS